jgi:hypothetical protein
MVSFTIASSLTLTKVLILHAVEAWGTFRFTVT